MKLTAQTKSGLPLIVEGVIGLQGKLGKEFIELWIQTDDKSPGTVMGLDVVEFDLTD